MFLEILAAIAIGALLGTFTGFKNHFCRRETISDLHPHEMRMKLIRRQSIMSYMKLDNTCIRENGHKVSIFSAVEKVKRDLKAVIPEIEDDKLLAIMCHCRRHYEGKLHYGRRGKQNPQPRELTHTERLVYDYMLRNKLNPSTAYRWFLATRIPDDVKEKLAKGQLSYKLAMRIAWNRKKSAETNQGLLLIDELRTIIRTL